MATQGPGKGEEFQNAGRRISGKESGMDLGLVADAVLEGVPASEDFVEE